jgi:hypothetical protein
MNALDQLVDGFLDAIYRDPDDLEPAAVTTHDYIPYVRGQDRRNPCAECGASRQHPLHLVRP